jgi:drug/metabolite transporter (DMT)-like permease
VELTEASAVKMQQQQQVRAQLEVASAQAARMAEQEEQSRVSASDSLLDIGGGSGGVGGKEQFLLPSDNNYGGGARWIPSSLPLTGNPNDTVTSDSISSSIVLSSSNPWTQFRRRWTSWTSSRLAGTYFLTLSAVLSSLVALLVSLLSARFSPLQLIFLRCLTLTIVGVASCRFLGVSLLGPADRRAWLTLRAVVGVVSFSLYFVSLATLQLADATTLYFTSPLFAGPLAYLMLREPLGRVELACTGVSMIGVIMVVRPAFLFGDNDGGGADAGGAGSDGSSTVIVDDPSASESSSMHTLGLFAAVAGSITSAGVYVLIRKVGQTVHPVTMVVYIGAVGTVMAPLDMAWHEWVWPAADDAHTWLLLASVGLVSTCAQALFNAGAQLEKANMSSMIRNLDVVFAFIWQISIQHEHPTGWSVIGALIVTLSVCAMAAFKLHDEKKMALLAAASSEALQHDNRVTMDDLATMDLQMDDHPPVRWHA